MSSQITNVITTTFRATGGNVVSQLRSYAAGFGTIGQQINETSNMSTRLNNQWRAIGTTIRYAVAGAALYGLTSMVSKVSQLNVQLAQMQAISNSGIGTSVGISNNQVPTLLNNLMNTSVATITPLTEVNDAATNFLSTVQNVKPSELPTMLAQIGVGARIAQTPIEDLTQAATTMQVAFNRKVNPQSIGQFSRMWQMLITTAPGARIAGSTIAQAMPGLASMFQLAPGKGVQGNVGQAQMMALTLGVLRTGMPASTGMRGLTYLLQSIAQPSAGAAKALAGIGITPQTVSQQGIFANVMKLLGTITHSGNAKQLGAIDDTTMDSLDSSNGNLPGIPAQEMTRLRAMIPRIHGIRAALILSSQLQQRGDVSSIQQDLQHMLEVQDANSKDSKNLAKSWDQFRKRARLAEAANAINTMGLQVAQTFEPIMGFAAQNVLDPVAGAARRHPRATRDITLGAGGFLAAMGIGRFLGAGRLPILRKIPGISSLLGGGGIGQQFVREQAIASAMGGGGLRDGKTPQSALYVTVVGQLFGGATPGPTPGPSTFGRFGKWIGGGAAGAATRFGSLFKRGPSESVGDLAMVGGGLLAVIHDLTGAANTAAKYKTIHWSPTGRPYMDVAGNLIDPKNMHKVIVNQARKVFGQNVTGVSGYHAAMWRGQADVNMILQFTDPHTGKLQRQRVHIPINMWAGGRHPTTRGQKKTVRSR